MRNKAFSFLTAGVFLLTLTGTAFAGGWGPYFMWGKESPSAGAPDILLNEIGPVLEDLGISLTPEQETLARDILGSADWDFDVQHVVFGLLYESAPNQDKLLSHRFAIGFDIATKTEITDISFPDNFQFLDSFAKGFTADLDQSSTYGFSLDYTMSFGLIRNDLMRLWVGPGFRLSGDYFDLDYGFEAGMVGIGGGGEAGVNLKVIPGIDLCIGGGIFYQAFGYGADQGDTGSLAWGGGPFYFLRIAALFHTGDDRQ